MKVFRFFFALICFFASASLLAQGFRIEGTVYDHAGKPLPLATVSLTDKAGETTGTVTDDAGHFSVEVRDKGTYGLSVTCIGHTAYEQTIEVTTRMLPLGNIMLHEASVALRDVVVTGKKKMVTREIDRIVLNVDALPVGNLNGVELMRAVPGVIVTDEEIRIVGKGSVRVLVDGRESKLSGKELMAALRSYRSEEVDKIEVITTPPAMYEAEGNAGLLNIRLKKKLSDYLGGSLSNSPILLWGHLLDEYSGALQYKKGSVSAWMNLAGGAGDRLFEQQYNRHFPEYEWESRTRQTNDNLYVAPRFGIDMALPHGLTVGMMMNFLYMRPDFENANRTRSFAGSEAEQLIEGTTSSGIRARQYDFNFHADKALDTLGKKLSLDIDMLDYGMSRDDRYASNTDFRFLSHARRDIGNCAAKLHILLPYRRFTVNFGGKYSRTKTDHTLAYAYRSASACEDDDFTYKEDIGAVFGDIHWTASRKWQFKLGLRMEHTATEGIPHLTGERNKRRYTRLFPTLYVAHTSSEKHILSLALARRLNRPSYQTANPAILYENEYSYAAGNPYLDPSYAYSATMTYTCRNNLTLSLSYSLTDDVFDRQMRMDPATGVTSYIWENYKKNRQVFIQGSYLFNRWDWLQSYLTQYLYWTGSETKHGIAGNERNGWSYYGSLYNTFYLNKARSFSGILSFVYSSDTYSADQVQKGKCHLGAGIRRTFLKGRVDVAFNVSTLLSPNTRSVTYDGDLRSDYKYIGKRSYTLSVTWHFGGSFHASRRTESNADEKKRL